MQASVSDEVVDVLTERYGPLTLVGAGAWSTAYRFERDGAPLVVRVGAHDDDFRIDDEMASFTSPTLPIPAVVELDRLAPPHDRLHVCVSTFAPGEPLEYVTPEVWRGLVPAVADLLETMRAIEAPGPVQAWPDVLLAEDGADNDRLAGWRERLAAEPDLGDGHRRTVAALHARCARPSVAEVQPSLIHGDLVNRNVHVTGGAITGVFDWGCRRWGDPLYDLAWFEFWSPWLPTLDLGLLRAELARRRGGPPDPDRLAACLLHIGAAHLVYNAAIDEPGAGREVLDRLRALALVEP